MRRYLSGYAEHFGIRERIRWRARIVEAAPTDNHRWHIVAEIDGTRDSAEYDYFVISPDMFNLKKIPDWPNREAFAGPVMHSSEFHDGARIAGKRVVIVGFSRSAMDVAMDIVDEAASVTLLYRSIRWPVPQKILACPEKRLSLGRACPLGGRFEKRLSLGLEKRLSLGLSKSVCPLGFFLGFFRALASAASFRDVPKKSGISG